MKRLKFIIAVLLVWGTASMLSIAWAQNPATIGSIIYNSSISAYEINSGDNLKDLAVYVNGTGTYTTGSPETTAHDCLGLTFKLTSDIEFSYAGLASGASNFTPIGGEFGNTPFSGTFDGNYHTIRGIRIASTDDCQGLFRSISGATVQNVVLVDASITGGQNVGCIVGYALSGTISNCHIAHNVIVTAGVYGSSALGGIVGLNDGASISGCTSAATITCGDCTACNFYGAIVGANNVGGTIENCLAIAATINASSEVGAIIGSNSGTLTKNYYAGCEVYNEGVPGTVGGTSSGDVNINDDDGAIALDKDKTVTIPLLNSADNTDVIAAIEAIEGNNFNYQLIGRTLIKDGKWNTLCLPFDATLDGATVMELDGENSNLTGGTLTLNFNAVQQIEEKTTLTAGKPYIVKWTSDSPNPSFSKVSIGATTASEVSFTGGKFVGTYGWQEFTEEDKSILFMGDDNMLYYPEAGAQIGAQRAYFQLNTTNPVKSFVLNFGEESALSGVSTLLANRREVGGEATLFTLAGRRVTNSHLPHGIYVSKGKKVFVK